MPYRHFHVIDGMFPLCLSVVVAGRGPDEAGLRLSAYFPLHRCVDGLRLLSEHLFGISLREQPLGRYEAWLDTPQVSCSLHAMYVCVFM